MQHSPAFTISDPLGRLWGIDRQLASRKESERLCNRYDHRAGDRNRRKCRSGHSEKPSSGPPRISVGRDRYSPRQWGSHLCDKTYVLPYAYERTYLDVVREVLRSETVDLIIPSTDYETYYLSTLRAEIPIVACSPPETNKMFLDKFMTYQLFGRVGLPFAQTTVASEYTGPSVGIVAKPREGRGSRGVIPNPS